MRQALNENPVVQIVLLGVLGIVVALLFVTRVMGGGEGSVEPEPVPTAAGTVTAPVATPPSVEGTAPQTDAPAATGTEAIPRSAAPFKAGPGLPDPVVRAHRSGHAVVLFVAQKDGIEDSKLLAPVMALAKRTQTTVFVTDSKRVARYSRIAEGVDLDRVPALVVIAPKRQDQGGFPMASIAYGFRGAEGVKQALADALYRGKSLPYHPG